MADNSNLARLPIWYHRMRFPDGEETQLIHDWSGPWSIIRETRAFIDHAGKRVLDTATFDGMWAFEAEGLGAVAVAATDAIRIDDTMEFVRRVPEKFLYARAKFGSRVVPYFNVSVHRLTSLLPFWGPFDIVYNLGLLYHLENPWQALKECRRMLRPGGHLLIETAIANGSGNVMEQNAGPTRHYPDDRSYWFPTEKALRVMLASSQFLPIEESIRRLHGSGASRISLACEALPGSFDHEDYRSL